MPQRVVAESPTLDPDVKGFLFSALLLMAMRTLIAWAVIAILIPGFGITFWMVYLGLVFIQAVKGPPPYDLIHASNRAARKRRAKPEPVVNMTANSQVLDDALLRARASSESGSVNLL